MNSAWEGIQALLTDHHQQYSGVANMWQQYFSAKQGVMKILGDVEPIVTQELAFTSQAQVKKSLDQHKVGAMLTLRKIAIWMSKNCQKLDFFFF